MEEDKVNFPRSAIFKGPGSSISCVDPSVQDVVCISPLKNMSKNIVV